VPQGSALHCRRSSYTLRGEGEEGLILDHFEGQKLRRQEGTMAGEGDRWPSAGDVTSYFPEAY